jgi:hypothetical protein
MISLIILFLILLGWGLHLAWRWKEARDFSVDLLAAKQTDGSLPKDVEAAEFTDLYLRSEGPRAATYIYTCAVLVAVLIAPFTTLMNTIWLAVWRATGNNPVFGTGTMIHTFSMFLFIMGLMVGLLAVAMRRYYALAPPTLKQVERDLRGGT